MTKEKIIALSVTAIFAVILVVAVANGLKPQSFGASGDTTSKRVDVYGSETNTTLASSTSKVIAIGPEYEKMSLNILASTTANQTVAAYLEYSNDANCDTATNWFRDTYTPGLLAFSLGDATAQTVSIANYNLSITTGVNKYSIAIGNNLMPALNAKCVKVNLSTSSTTVPAIAWAEAYISN